MAFDLEFRPDAERDIVEARDWYESQSDGLGQQLVESIDAVISQIRHRPAMYAIAKRGVRLARVPGFPYVIAYLFANEEIKVISVFHGHRDPKTWQSRI